MIVMTYIALLRGINVGGRVIKMAELKKCFEGADFTGVRAILQTGNIIFASAKDRRVLQSEIEALLAKTFNYPAQVQIYTVDELAGIIKANPFAGSDAAFHQYVIFLDADPAKRLVVDISGLEEALETAQHGNSVIYWRVQKGMTLKSDFAKRSAKLPRGTFSTTRNINTLQKIITAAKA